MGILLLSSCQKEYVKTYDLSVDAYKYTLGSDGLTFPVYVYCSNEWTATFDAEQDWLKILDNTDKGRGNGLVRLKAQPNDKEFRTVNLVLKSGKFVKTINISQNYNSIKWEIE